MKPKLESKQCEMLWNPDMSHSGARQSADLRSISTGHGWIKQLQSSSETQRDATAFTPLSVYQQS